MIPYVGHAEYDLQEGNRYRAHSLADPDNISEILIRIIRL
jgi:hypothetical protein